MSPKDTAAFYSKILREKRKDGEEVARILDQLTEHAPLWVSIIRAYIQKLERNQRQ